MEKMRHIVLFLPCPAFPKALNEQDGLEYPQIRFGRKPGIGEDLRSKHIVDTYLGRVSCNLISEARYCSRQADARLSLRMLPRVEAQMRGVMCQLQMDQMWPCESADMWY